MIKAAKPSCFRLFWHCATRAASRAACTAGNNSAMRIPMMVMTTNNSTSVKARAEHVRQGLRVDRDRQIMKSSVATAVRSSHYEAIGAKTQLPADRSQRAFANATAFPGL